MPRRLVVCCLLLVCVTWFAAFSVGVQAGTVRAADNTELAFSPLWLALLHMQRNALTGSYHSEVDADAFFLSNKKNDSAAEMNATLRALRFPADGDDSAWCRFPARAQFLSQHFSLKKPENLHCYALDYWRSRFSTDEMVMVYPDPYLKNIASIFGHTFLRLDAFDKADHPILLSQAISYYADVGSADNSAALYIAKGLTGHFPGIIEVAPYFEKLREYSDSEDRDIREYTLTLPQEKIRTFVDHLWEVRGSSFNYFFLDENCSYRLISLLDVVTPTHNLREAFATHTIPVDTVKVLQAHGLIASSRYIPSARKRFYAQQAQLGATQKVALKKLLQGNVAVDEENDPSVLAVAEQYRGIQMQSEPENRLLRSTQTNQLIRRQHVIGAVAPATHDLPDAADPLTQGHGMMRLQTGWQHDDGRDYLLLGGRFAYHDFHDPLPAFQQGVQLDVLDFQLRIDPYQGSDHVSIDHIRWFNLQSYSPSDNFFQESSWGFSVARQRELIDKKTKLINIAEGYRGITRRCGAMLCHAEILGGALTGNALENGWDLRIGTRAGVLYQNKQWSWSADITQQYQLVNSSDTLSGFTTTAGYRISRDLSAFLSYTHQENDEASRDRFLLSLRSFF